MDFDAIVIGSGFGGSVSSCRLAQAGYRVLVLERGRRWDRTNYPRKPTDHWWWDQENPERWNGWIDLRIFRHMAVSFDKTLSFDGTNPIDPQRSKRFTNDQGVEQGTCVHLGNCDIGCDVDAKNTLDRNYLALAERSGAEVRPLHMVTAVEPAAGGYLVHFDRLDNGERRAGSASARLVIVAGGSLNSTELLLRCRDVSRTLPQVSKCLGWNWSGNGDFLTPAFYLDRKLHPSLGPTITSEI